jgi:hypothetical protein
MPVRSQNRLATQGAGRRQCEAQRKRTVIDTIAAILGGVICLALLFAFARSIWRKPPDDPGSSSSTGGLPPGTIGIP